MKASRFWLVGVCAGAVCLHIAFGLSFFGYVDVRATFTDGQDQQEPTAVIDWSVPNRYGLDRNGDGVIDRFDNPNDIQPALWTVTLNGCDSAPVGGIVDYRWRIEQTEGQPIFEGSSGGNCEFTFDALPGEGVYQIQLQVTDASSGVDSVSQEVVIQDWLIVGFGDSYSSGEGVPDIPRDPNTGRAAVWQDEVCHRSANSLQSKFALLLEALDPKTSVTFVHPACSGARITTGELREQPKPLSPTGLVPPQVENLPNLIGTREIDVMLNGIGGNDVSFVDIVASCMLQEPCYLDQEYTKPDPAAVEALQAALCGNLPPLQELPCNAAVEAAVRHIVNAVFPESAGQLFARGRDGVSEAQCFFDDEVDDARDGPCTGLAPGTAEGDQCQLLECTGLKQKYALLQDDLSFFLPDFDQTRQVTYAYPDFTQRRDDAGELVLCQPNPDDPSASLPGVSQMEWQWARDVLLSEATPPDGALEDDDLFNDPGLNFVMRDASAEYGWNYVAGLKATYGEHGYCADPGVYWVNHLTDVLAVAGGNGGGAAGWVHPNVGGLTAYCTGLANAIFAELYPDAELPAFDCASGDNPQIMARPREPRE